VAKILLHSLVFSPEANSTSYLMTDLARQLRALGHEVTVLTTTPHNNLEPGAIARQPLRRVWPGLLYRSELGDIPVWHVQLPLKGNRVLRRMLDYIRFHAVALTAGITRVGPYDVVLSPSPPLTIGIAGWMLARWRRTPAVYNVQEIYPDFAINQGLIRNRVFIRLLRQVERMVYASSSRVVTISEWFSRTIRERGVPEDKLLVIPNFVDTELYRPLPRHNAFSGQHGLDDDFVVLYAGNIGLSQDWESLLFAAAQHAELPIRYVIVGDGARRQWLENEVRRRRLENVRLLGYQPRERMPEINASSDIHTIPMKRETTRDTFPSKIYSILASARPAVVSADPDSELEWVIQRAGSGRVVTPEDPQAYADAVLRAYVERDGLAAEGQRGRRFVEGEYSKEAVGRKYDRLIRELLSPTTSATPSGAVEIRPAASGSHP
jgi:colanic acid biosynthesis glycosyl transferase WcaI